MPDLGTVVHDLRYAPAGRAVVSAGKGLLRAGAMATAPLRPPFDFLVIGAKRGGTTSLWRYLAAHPGILDLFPRAANVKGTYWFADEWAHSKRWWRSHAPSQVTRTRVEQRLGYRPLVGDSSPYYLFHPLAPARVATELPSAVAIAVLRDPVERAWSHYKERRANNTEPLPFPRALEVEAVRLRGEEERILTDPTYRSFPHRHQSYVAQGCYGPMLARWFDALGRDRVLVLVSEELYADPQAAVDSVTERLGLPRHELADRRAHNAEPSDDLDVLHPGVRAELRERLAPHIAATEEVLGRALPWPR